MNVKATVHFKRSAFIIYPVTNVKHEMETGEKYLGDKCFAHIIRLIEFCHSYKL